MKKRRAKRLKSSEIVDQVRLLSLLVRNQYYLMNRSNSEALHRGLNQYLLLRGLCQVKFLQHWWRRDDLTNQAARSATSLQV